MRSSSPVPRIVEIHCVQTDGGGGNMIQCGDGGNMIQCDACNQWFHDVCIKTNTRVWENLDYVWLFITCSRI